MPYSSIEKRRSYQNAYHQQRYRSDADYRERHKERTKNRNARALDIVDQMIATFRANGCALCPEKSACCLVAHHLDPTQKDFHISQAKWKRIGRAKIAAELSKCICLCANCHAKVHAGETSLTAQQA